MKIIAALPLAVSSDEIDGPCPSENHRSLAIKECGSDVASTNSVSVTVPGVHLTLERGAMLTVTTTVMLPRATSTKNSGPCACEHQ